jgi:predicted enzyme related to lactoylglutathione lyase
MPGKADTGKIGWIDITVDDAGGLRDFYAKVVGWKPEDVSMGEYSDFNMTMPGSGEPAAGICHARGGNAELPSCWLIYIVVDDAAESAGICADNGGKVLVQPKSMGGGSFCVIEDPSGAVAALYQPPAA